MLMTLSLFKVLLPLVYLVVWGLYLWLFIGDSPTARKYCSRVAVLAVLLHVGAMVLRGIAHGRLPMGNNLEFFSALALASLATYLFIEHRLKAKNTGVLVTGMAFIFEFIADAFLVTPAPDNPLLKDPGYAGHAVLVLISYTALSLSFMYALLYLLLSRQLMKHQFGLLFRRLPSLEILEKMSVGAVKLAIPLMFGALALGHLWMYDLAERVPSDLASQLSPYDPKILISWAIFFVYTFGLAGYQFLGWRGRRMNIMAVIAFVLTFSAMGLVHHFFPSFHKFRSIEVAVDNQQPNAGPTLVWADGEVSS